MSSTRLFQCLLSLLMFAPLFGSDCEDWQRKIHESPRNPDYYYSAATCLAREGKLTEAMYHLNEAVERGFRESEQMGSDTDLEPLRQSPQWQELLEITQKNEAIYLKVVHKELYQLFKEDQKHQRLSQHSPEQVEQRLKRVREIVAKKEMKMPDDFYHAAQILYNGSTTKDFMLAMNLAKKAVGLDPQLDMARVLACTAEDRYLHATNKPQVWGTQFHLRHGKYTLEPFDKEAKTDKERKAWRVPTLEELEKKLETLNENQ